MRKNVSIKDVEMVREIVSQKHVVDFFKSWLDSNNVEFHVTRSIFDKIEIKCRYYDQNLECQKEYTFIVDLDDRSKCKVSVILEGLYQSEEIDILLQFTRLFENQIGSHLRLNEFKKGANND